MLAAHALHKIGVRDAWMRLPCDELRGRRGHTSPHAAAEVSLHSLGRGAGPAVGLEALEVEPESLGAPPQMRVVEVALILEQRVVHLPEAALERGGLRRRGEHA